MVIFNFMCAMFKDFIEASVLIEWYIKNKHDYIHLNSVCQHKIIVDDTKDAL